MIYEYNYDDIFTVFIDYTYIDFVNYCILCGCDYYKLEKMASKKAKLLSDKCVKITKGQSEIEKVTYILKEINKIKMGEDRKFGKALLMFLKSTAYTFSTNLPTDKLDVNLLQTENGSFFAAQKNLDKETANFKSYDIFATQKNLDEETTSCLENFPENNFKRKNDKFFFKKENEEIAIRKDNELSNFLTTTLDINFEYIY